MKLFKSIVLTLFGLLILTTSCKNQKTYAERLRDERKAIDLFIAKNNLQVLKNFPSNGKFNATDFYKDPNTGVYFNIIEYGDTTVKPQWREKISIRFKGLSYFSTEDTIKYTNHQSTFPEQLEYVGPVSTMTKDSYATAGWAVPLSYVGHKGKVKMIIPFQMGSTYDRNNSTPTYYDQIEYRFESQW